MTELEFRKGRRKMPYLENLFNLWANKNEKFANWNVFCFKRNNISLKRKKMIIINKEEEC